MSSATAAAGGVGSGGNQPTNNNNKLKLHDVDSDNEEPTHASMAAAAASGGGEITAGYESEDDEESTPRQPEIPQLAEPLWKDLVKIITSCRTALVEGNSDPNLTKWSKENLPRASDIIEKLNKHVVERKIESIFEKMLYVLEVEVHGRPCDERKEDDKFVSSFRECNELVLCALCAFVSLRGGFHFEKEQVQNQYEPAGERFASQLIAVNRLLLDCSPAPLDGDWDNEEDAPAPQGNWKEYIEIKIQERIEEFYELHSELIFWSRKLKSLINFVELAESKQEEEKEIMLMNEFKLSISNNSKNENQHHGGDQQQEQEDPTSVNAVRRQLRLFYHHHLALSQAVEGDQENGSEDKFDKFFCNLRLKKRQQKEGEQQSVTEGEFVSASHLPTRLRSAAHTVLVTGPGGAGKTVALKHICIQQGVEDSVIVFVPLKELRGMPRRIKSIADIFENCSVVAALSEEQIEAIVEKRIPVIFAFDGFDEVHNAQEEDKNIAHFFSDMIDPKKRKFSLDHGLLPDLVRSCDRVIISSREERIASANCNLDSAEARPLVDELAVQLWTNSEVERFCLRFFSNAFKKQEQEQQNQKGEKQEQQLAKAVRTATNDVISSLASPLMDSWRGLPLAVTLLSELRSSSSENSKHVLDNMSPARAYSLVLEMHWRRSEMRVADRLLRCKRQYVLSCMNDHNIDLNQGVTPELFELVLNSAAEASFKQLLSTNSNVTEISFSSSSSSSSSSSNKLPLWAALLRETGLIRVENNNSKATFSHRSWIEFLCARHAATSSKNAIDQIPWDQSKFASVWLLLADFARSGTFEKSLSVQRFSFAAMSKYRENIRGTVKEREGVNRLSTKQEFDVDQVDVDQMREHLTNFDVDKENSKASISLLARITNIIKPESLFSELSVLSFSHVIYFRGDFLFSLSEISSDATKSENQFLTLEFSSSLVPQLSESELLEEAKKSLEQLPKLIKREAVACSKCKAHFAEAPADWKCNKCNVLVWNPDTSNCEICNKSFGLFTRRHHTRCCGKCVCSDCVFDEKKVSRDKYFCESCVSGSVFRLKLVSHFNCIESKFVDALQKDFDNEIRSARSKKSSLFLESVSNLSGLVVVEDTWKDTSLPSWSSPSQKQTMAANSFILHLRWLAELCVAEGALDCFKFIEKKHPFLRALFGVFKQEDLEFAKSEILSPALARALDHLDRPAVSACVEYIINKYNVEVQLEDAIRLNSLVGVTRAIKKMEKENFSLDVSVEKDVERGEKIMELFSEAMGKRQFDVVAAMLRCRRDEQGRFLWCQKILHPVLLQLLFRYIFPQDLQFRVWCEEKKDFETSSLSDLAKLLHIDLSSNMKCEKFKVQLSEAEQHLWIPFFHLFVEVVFDSYVKIFSLTPSTSPGQLRVLGLTGNKTVRDEELAALVGKCSQLEEIDLPCTKFTDASLRALAACASTLRSLNLSASESFTDAGLAALVSKCTQLEKIDLSYTKFGDASLRALASCASTLRSLNLDGNRSFTDVGLAALVSKCSKLEEVNLSYTNFTDASLNALAACGPTLRRLNLSGNENFTDAGRAALVSKCTQLEEVNLSSTRFGDASLQALATCGSTLRSLDLCYNETCTDVALAVLVSKCTQLEEINLSGFGTKFGDASLRALAASPSVTQQKPPTLVEINLCSNKNFTDAGIDILKEAYGAFWSKVWVNTSDCDNIKNK